MYLMKVPSLSKPTAARIRARQQRGEDQAVDAVRLTVAATSTMKAPAGPPIWKRLPPSAETRKPPTIAGKAAIRRDARGDGDRHRQRQRDDRDGKAGEGVGPKFASP